MAVVGAAPRSPLSLRRETSWKREVRAGSESERQEKKDKDIVFVCVWVLGWQVFVACPVFVYIFMCCLYGDGCLCIVCHKNDFFLSNY